MNTQNINPFTTELTAGQKLHKACFTIQTNRKPPKNSMKRIVTDINGRKWQVKKQKITRKGKHFYLLLSTGNKSIKRILPKSQVIFN